MVTTAAGRSMIVRLVVPRATQAEPVATTAVAQPIAWWTVGAAALMPVLLTTGWLVADAVQPRSYSPVRQTVSVLSGHAGVDRWIVTTALYLIGVAYFVTAAGLPALGRPARVGLVVAGAAAIGVASLPEPAHGSSQPHALCTVIGALTLTIWPALVARQESVLARVGVRRSIVAIAVSVALFGWTVLEMHNGSALGLAERVSSALQSGWPFVVALALRRSSMDAALSRSPVDASLRRPANR